MKSDVAAGDSEVYSQCLTELRRLIRTGLSGSGSLEHSKLISLPVVRQEAGNNANLQRRIVAFIHIFERIVSVRLSGKNQETAVILFALGTYAGLPMQDRFTQAAKLYHRHWTWENYRKEPLTRLLHTLLNHLLRETELYHQQPHNTEKSIGLIGQQWQTVEYTAYYQFPATPGEPIIGTQQRRLRSMTDGCQVWSYRIRWKLKGRLEPPVIKLQGKGSLCITDTWATAESGQGFTIVQITLPQPVDLHQTVTVTLLVTLACDYHELTRVGRTDWFGLLPAVNTMDRVSVKLRFPRKTRPKTVWLHEAVYDGLVYPGTPNPDSLVKVDETGYVEHTWSPAETGYSHGISMQW